MPTYSEQMQRIASKYERSTGKTSYTAREVATWAIDTDQWEAPKKVLISRCADDLSRALREVYYTDPQGRRARKKHVAIIKKNGEQLSLWMDVENAPRVHMLLAFQQRRRGIVGDCKQLKVDVDSYNDNFNEDEPIQMSFNFTKDVLETEINSQAKARSSGESKLQVEKFLASVLNNEST